MFCPKCGNTVGYTKVTETSKPIKLKGLTVYKAIKKTEIEGVFFNNGPIEIICNNCGNKMEEEIPNEDFCNGCKYYQFTNQCTLLALGYKCERK